MAPLLTDINNNNNSSNSNSNSNSNIMVDARQAALDEAASVLRAISSNRSGDVDDHDDELVKTTPAAAVEKDESDNATTTHVPAGAADANLTKSNGSTGDLKAASATAPQPKLSRSDAVAAAKKRAEERKRANKYGGDGKKQQPSSSSSSSSAAAATANNATTTTAGRSPSRKTVSKSTTVSSKPARNVNPAASMDWFNLLGVVTNPSGGNYYESSSYLNNASSPSPSSHYRQNSYHRSRHGGLSSHGNPISLDHVGSDGTRGSVDMSDNTVAGSLLNAAGLNSYAPTLAAGYASTNATLNNVASSLDEFTGWFDHYSRKYLGTVAGIDGGSILGEDDPDADSGGGALGAMSSIMNSANFGSSHFGNGNVHPGMLAEYAPDFGPDDLPLSQLEELPRELSSLDLTSVERYLRGAGMLGMRFEDRGGGFRAVRERIGGDGNKRADGGADGEEKKEVDAYGSPMLSSAVAGQNHEDADNAIANNASMDHVLQTVPPIFFSPYFDLTDPGCFENLLVISDEEVKQIREKEAELHALADRKVKEAEEVAMMDAENENVVARPPARKGAGGDTLDGDAGDDGQGGKAASAGTSLTNKGKTTSTPTDNNVITLRKPETFTTHLDDIELVLLDQVRSKSERFFRETNRFSELQHLVTTSVDEVRELRTELHSIRERCVTNVEVVPIMDDSRRDLRSISRVLEAVEDVVNCKASIASLMGAGDHLGAVEAIRLARSLLAESPEDDDDDGSEDGDGDDPVARGKNASPSKQQQHNQQQHLSLGKLKALSKVSEQLNEYEKLVVQNLTDELVETFLSWGTGLDANGGSGTVDYRAPPRISLTTDKRSKIRGVVQSLRVCGKLSGAGAVYRKKLCELISVTVKAVVTECVADANSGNANNRISVDGTNSRVGGGATHNAKGGTMAGVASMTLEQFFDCINMLFEQVLGLLWGAFAVNKFCIDEGFILDDGTAANAEKASGGDQQQQHTPSATAAALAAAADLSEKSVSELLRLRREAHSLVSFDGMRHLWDASLSFTHQLEKFSGRKAYGLRSTLLAQAKSFVERKHEGNMSALVAALDSERWVQCSVSAERQAALTRLCSGRAAFSSRKTATPIESTANGADASTKGSREKMTDAEVEGSRYKVVWSALLLLEMVMDDVACAAHFQTLAANVVSKVAELLRLFNTRATHLVLGAGAIHSAARLKSINAKHLAIVTQCIAVVLSILPHVRAALMAQLPAKQHGLLYDLDKIKGDYKEHSEKILSKLVSIIGGIVEHSLAPRIAGTDFDGRANKRKGESSGDCPAAVVAVDCCQFLDNVVTNTKKMHQVLLVMLPPELLRDVFSRIFAYLDHKVPSLFKAAAAASNVPTKEPEQQKKKIFAMPSTDEGKLQMIEEVEYMSKTLNGMAGVEPWNFVATKTLELELDITRESAKSPVVFEMPEEPVLDSAKNEEAVTEESEVEEQADDENDGPAAGDSTESTLPSTEGQGDLNDEKKGDGAETPEASQQPASEEVNAEVTVETKGKTEEKTPLSPTEDSQEDDVTITSEET